MEVDVMVLFNEQEHQFPVEVCIFKEKKVFINLLYFLLKELLNLEINYL